MKKFWEHRSLAPIPAFSKQLATIICPNHNDTSEDLPDKYNSKQLLLFKRQNLKFQKIFECFFFTYFRFLAINALLG